MNIAGVVILYNPDEEVIDNIESYLSELDTLLVFDNSENPNVNIVEKIKVLPRVQYISFGENKGISYALNHALTLAKDYKFLLTMDQDSKFYEGMMRQYKNYLERIYSKDNSVAMFSVHYDGLKISTVSNEFVDVERAITSGSVVNIDIARRIGGFDENLFIDEVDHEFCYRARTQGYRIICISTINMHHNMGKPISIGIFGKKYLALNHNPVRKYYIFRNTIYVMKKYPDVRGRCVMELFKSFIKMVLVEPDKWNKTLFAYKGLRDAFAGKMGKFDKM